METMPANAANRSTGSGSRPRFVFVMPVYNHGDAVTAVIWKAKALGYPVIVVDDGSTDGTAERIAQIPHITVLRHPCNQGKGAALMTGLASAAEIADWAVTIDADGQHDPADAPHLIRAVLESACRPLAIGVRQGMDAGDVHWTSRFGRVFSNFWVWCSGGRWSADTQSGFRIYPLPEALNLNVRSGGYQFEIEILAKAGWRRIPVVEAPVSVDYRPGRGRQSHFRPFVDFMRNFCTFARLITQRIFIPAAIRGRLLASAANRMKKRKHVEQETGY
jgi:glycosyltransferase involved in cell wall biosynthesis